MGGLTPGLGPVGGYPWPITWHTTGLRWALHGRSARAVEGGLEICVPDGSGARSLAGF